jgi:hypothetical protein
VGFLYESPAQAAPVFDAKGIETVRCASEGGVLSAQCTRMRTGAGTDFCIVVTAPLPLPIKHTRTQELPAAAADLLSLPFAHPSAPIPATQPKHHPQTTGVMAAPRSPRCWSLCCGCSFLRQTSRWSAPTARASGPRSSPTGSRCRCVCVCVGGGGGRGEGAGGGGFRDGDGGGRVA